MTTSEGQIDELQSAIKEFKCLKIQEKQVGDLEFEYENNRRRSQEAMEQEERTLKLREEKKNLKSKNWGIRGMF